MWEQLVVERVAANLDTGSFTVIGNGLTRLQPLDPANLAEAFIQSPGNEKALNKIFKMQEAFTIEFKRLEQWLREQLSQ